MQWGHGWGRNPIPPPEVTIAVAGLDIQPYTDSVVRTWHRAYPPHTCEPMSVWKPGLCPFLFTPVGRQAHCLREAASALTTATCTHKSWCSFAVKHLLWTQCCAGCRVLFHRVPVRQSNFISGSCALTALPC